MKINYTLWRGEDCTKIDIVVDYDYQPFEDAEPYGDPPYPGCDEEVTITEATCDGKVIELDQEELKEIEKTILRRLHDEND